jgi:peptidoglycan-associated lipoprotein
MRIPSKSIVQSATFAFALAGLLALPVLSTGCAKKQQPDEMSTATDMGDMDQLGDSDSGKAMGMETIRFPYDSFTLTEEAKNTLNNNATIMKDKASLRVQIEGHCDVRGGIQYNIALGEKRANAVRKYLEGMGVAGERLSTISYGKERLIDQNTSDEAHGRNRRANFAITSR